MRGAKTIMHPDQFDAVVAVLSRRELRAHHVVVAESLEPLVREAVGRLSPRHRVDLQQALDDAWRGAQAPQVDLPCGASEFCSLLRRLYSGDKPAAIC